jgi:hypothetical protein
MCSGTVNVDGGYLGGGTSPMAVAAAAYSPVGIRLLLSTNASDGCSVESGGIINGGDGYLSENPDATIELTLAPDIAPGTYDLASSSEINAWVLYTSSTGNVGQPLISGTLTLTTVSPAAGLAGSYHMDFGTEFNGMTVAGMAVTNGSGRATSTTGSMPNLGEFIEDGTFVAPICELCNTPPGCFGDAECPGDQVCSSLGGCVAAPVCSGAPSCSACGLDCEGGGACETFDGFTEYCEIIFH